MLCGNNSVVLNNNMEELYFIIIKMLKQKRMSEILIEVKTLNCTKRIAKPSEDNMFL